MRGDGEVVIALVYPRLLGTYGDNGNALVLQRRLQWRGIRARIHPVDVGDTIPEQCDLYVLGGAEDGAGRTAAGLLAEQPGLRRAVDAGRPLLAVCAGFQLLGHEVATGTEHYQGAGLLDVATGPMPTRAIGEVLASPVGAWSAEPLTGFENHRGATTLGPSARPLATVLRGVGNGPGDPVEGAVQGNIVATYLHGPVLARNPALADFLLGWAVGGELGPLAIEAVAQLRSERMAHHSLPLRRTRHRDWWRSRQLGHRQQDRGALQRLEAVPGIGNDDQVTPAALPGQLT